MEQGPKWLCGQDARACWKEGRISPAHVFLALGPTAGIENEPEARFCGEKILLQPAYSIAGRAQFLRFFLDDDHMEWTVVLQARGAKLNNLISFKNRRVKINLGRTLIQRAM